MDRTDLVAPNAILAFITVRNEMARLPHFLQYYRDLGVGHFLFVDNDSKDGTRALLAEQPDVSLWTTPDSFRLSRFGMDWLGWLHLKYGHGHWCLTVDADELLVYPHCDERSLVDLTMSLDQSGLGSFGALMLDMYPQDRVGDQPYTPGDDPIDALPWFDHDNYWSQWHTVYDNLWIQGGVRARRFFADEPMRAPTLNKTPLVRWNRRFAYVNSTHQILPRDIHDVFGTGGNAKMTGVLLHTKFLNTIVDKSVEELRRRQHFANSDLYVNYHQTLAGNPVLWHSGSSRYEGWQQLVDLGLMSKGDGV